jgi:hypothetical protein
MARRTHPTAWKRWLTDLLVFGVPALLLSMLLQKLSGTALWIPAPWRQTIYVLILGAGMACFQLARRHGETPHARSSPAARTHSVETLVLAVASAGGSAQLELTEQVDTAGADDAGAAAPARDDGARQHLALACFLGALLLLVPQVLLRFHCVVAWEPDRAAVASLYGDPDRPHLPADLASVAPPVQLVETASGFRGSVLVPLRSRMSAELREQIESRAAYYDQPGIRAYLDHEPVRFIEALEDERRAMSETVILFLAVHAAILLLASAGYGFSFTLAEELLQMVVPGPG